MPVIRSRADRLLPAREFLGDPALALRLSLWASLAGRHQNAVRLYRLIPPAVGYGSHANHQRR